ncbi:hypothetical protein NDU88_004165, partial [Pleurodeles waltl]
TSEARRSIPQDQGTRNPDLNRDHSRHRPEDRPGQRRTPYVQTAPGADAGRTVGRCTHSLTHAQINTE